MNLATVYVPHVRLHMHCLSSLLINHKSLQALLYKHDSGSREECIPIWDVEYPIRMGNASLFILQNPGTWPWPWPAGRSSGVKRESF